MRSDLEMIDEWIQPNLHVLDLACGPGELLHHLINNKQITGYGLEIGPEDLNTCLEKGIPVLEQNIDEGLQNFEDHSFDLVLMTHALQQFRRPDLLIDEMLRIGKECIITFPNFGHWRSRMHLALKGRMPVSDFLPYNWYDTPNIHFFTFQDFERLCNEKGIKILRWAAVDGHLRDHWWIRTMPNMFSETAIFHITR